MATPHDALFKQTFELMDNARVELQAVLPKELAARVDWATLALSPGSFTAVGEGNVHADLLYTVELRGQPAYVYVLFEHQSRVDPWMPLRLLGYIVRMLEHHRSAHPDDKILPVVLPVVLHHSDTGWTAATEFHGLFDPDVVGDPAVAALVPSFRFVLDDVSHATDADLRSRVGADQRSAVPVVLWAFRDARHTEDFLAALPRWVDALARLSHTADGHNQLWSLLSYFTMVVEGVDNDAILSVVANAVPESQEVLMTLAEQWKREGRMEGLAKGERLILCKQLRLKFGELAPETEQRIAAASPTDLETYAERILTAASIADVFR